MINFLKNYFKKPEAITYYLKDEDFNPYDIPNRSAASDPAIRFASNFGWMTSSQRRNLSLLYDISMLKGNEKTHINFRVALQTLLGSLRTLNVQNESLTSRVKYLYQQLAKKEDEIIKREKMYQKEITKLIGIISSGNNLYQHLDESYENNTKHIFGDLND
jgi:hypothetical protein